MDRMDGVVIGLVNSVEDPAKRGRLEVVFPWLADGENTTGWARVATLMSGPGRGSWFMPEKHDEVLVAFEHGDPQHPYIIGYLWNGKDKPPNDDIGDDHTKVRRLHTVSGHRVDFDDRASKEKIVVTTHGEHKIEIVDAPDTEKRIKVTSKGGHVIHLDDVDVTKSVTISTAAGHEIKMDDKPLKKISVKTAGGITLELIDEPQPQLALTLSPGGPTVTADQQSMKVSFNPATFVSMDQSSMKLQFSPTSYIELSAASIKIQNTTLVEINP
jgi:uncharacterized protein involved in type VI secretion and phage assembly